LIAALNDPDRCLRGEALRSLGVLHDGRTISRLIKVLRTHPDADDRTDAAYALGCFNNRRATAALRQVLADRDELPVVRGIAAEQLVYTKAAIPDLFKGLRDPSREVRFWSAYALGEGRVKAAVPALRRLTRDRSRVQGWWSVAREARWALGVIDAGWTGKPPDPWKPVKAR
jgi:HEAT repeat protein